MADTARRDPAQRIKDAWANSTACSDHELDEWTISLLTPGELAALAERAEGWAKKNPQPDGHCRWRGHDYWGAGYYVGRLEVCAACEPAARDSLDGET